MGKSSGGGGGATGSQTIIQDIAEPFKGFATRSLQRAEDLQGLPSIPFTGIATAPPSPDELVAAQALRNRFMEAQPLTEDAIALQATAADPITAASIQARQNPFEAQIAQEAYRRLDERTQRDLQNQRAREAGAGGTDRGRGAIEDHLIRQAQQDQERQIGLEAGQRAFTNASSLALADRQARADTAAGINARLAERQSLGRRDIDDLLRVGAQFREKFVQPELNLERQQFGEFRGPASVQNPFGFEQFFSGIQSVAPMPTTTTTQNFAQTPSGLSQAVPAIGGAISAGNQLGFFNEGGIANFHQGGLAEHQRADHSHPEHDPGVVDQVIRVLQEQGHLVKGPEGRMEFGIRMLNDPSFKPLYEQAMAGVVESSGYLPPMLDTETVVEEARVEPRPQSRETGRSDFDAMVDTHGQLAKGFTDERQRVGGIEAAALARAEEEMRHRAISPQTLREAGQRRFDEARMDRQDWLGGERERRKTLSDPQASQWSESMGIEEEEEEPNFIPEDQKARLEAEENLKFHHDVETFRNTQPDQARIRNKFTAPYMAQSLANLGEGEEFTESTSEPDMDEGSDVGMAPYVEEEAPAEYWAESMGGLPDRMAEAVEGRAVSPEAPEPERKYTDSEITAMMEFSMTGRGRERLPKEMFGLDTLEVHDALKPIRERARKASAPRRAQERRDRIANRRGFRRNSGGIRDSDTPSYDITFDDIKEIFNFKDGGLTSLNQGGIARFDEGKTVRQDVREMERQQEVIDEMEKALQRYNPRQQRAWWKGFKEEKDVALGRIPDYPAIAMGDEEIIEIANIKKAKETKPKVKDTAKAKAEAEAKAKADEPKKEPRKNQIELMMEDYRESLNAPTKKGYPDRIPLSDKQRKGAAIQAFANALMAVKSDKFGGTDFSGMGAAAAQSAQKTLAGYEAARKEEIARRTAQRAAMLEGAEKFSKIYKNMGETEKAMADAAVAQAKADYPGLEIIKAVAPALAIQLAQGFITQARYDAALQGAVESFLRQQGGNTGLNRDELDTSYAETASETQPG